MVLFFPSSPVPTPTSCQRPRHRERRFKMRKKQPAAPATPLCATRTTRTTRTTTRTTRNWGSRGPTASIRRAALWARRDRHRHRVRVRHRGSGRASLGATPRLPFRRDSPPSVVRPPRPRRLSLSPSPLRRAPPLPKLSSPKKIFRSLETKKKGKNLKFEGVP